MNEDILKINGKECPRELGHYIKNNLLAVKRFADASVYQLDKGEEVHLECKAFLGKAVLLKMRYECYDQGQDMQYLTFQLKTNRLGNKLVSKIKEIEELLK